MTPSTLLRASCFLPVLALAGCVVPAGPEWVDPQTNVPPSIVSADPPVGSVLTNDSEAGTQASVQVTLADQNSADTLYVRWIIDYPPYVDGTSTIALRQSLPGGRGVARDPIAFAPSCGDIVHDLASHRLLLAVSDRPFAADNSDLPSNGYLLEAAWTFTLSCQ
jgi:hypothetical protein